MSIDDLPVIDTSCDEFEVVPEKLELDRRLANWEQWMDRRKRINRKFETRFGRGPSKLLTNAAEDRKEDDETKRIIEYARIPVWDKYRGDPTRWVAPPMLAKSFPDDLEYRLTLTRQERCLVPEIEYVKVPDVIKEEKEVVFTRNLYDINKSKYLANMLKQERVLEIVPHRPDMREIVVIGKSLQNEAEKARSSAFAALSRVTVEEIQERPKVTDYLLSLNELQLFPTDTGIRSVKLFSEAPANTLECLRLEIHNNSHKAIRFVLQSYSKRRVLGKIMPDSYSGLFTWNKNTHVLQPAEKIDFFIYFKGSIHGSFTRTLQMLTIPNLWDSPLTILIIINANVVKYHFESWCWKITLHLENQIRYRMVSETLDSCLQKIPRKKSDIIMYSYDKAAIFESINAFYNNNVFCVRYLYDKNVVDELENFYNSVRLDRHCETWDYRIDTLRMVTKHRENQETVLKLRDDLDNLVEKIDKCNVTRKALENQVESFWKNEEGKTKGKGKPTESKTKNDKTKKGDKSKKDDKSQKKSEKLVERVRTPVAKTLSDDLEALVGKLRSPTVWKLEHSRKLQLSYTLFCAYIDKICIECKELDLMFGIIKVSPKQLSKIYIDNNRFYDEKLNESNIQHPGNFDLFTRLKDKPAPPWTSTIPLKNYAERYNAFKAEKTATSSKTSGKPSLQNPFSSIILENEEEFEEMYEEEEEDHIPQEIFNHYKNNLYIIFNHNLWLLVDDMLAAFELVPKPQIKLDDLRQIRLTADEDLGEDENEVRIFDLKKAISDVIKETPEEAACTCECVCELNQSLLDVFQTYQSKTCALSKYTDDEIAAMARVEEFHDIDVMTAPVTDIPSVIPEAGVGVCGTIEEVTSASVECICKIKSLHSSFYYYDSVTGFDVPPSNVLSSSSDEKSCKSSLE